MTEIEQTPEPAETPSASPPIESAADAAPRGFGPDACLVSIQPAVAAVASRFSGAALG